MRGAFRKKSGKWGVFFCKKSGPFLNAGCIMYSISIFLFYILLIWGCVRTQPTPFLRACFDKKNRVHGVSKNTGQAACHRSVKHVTASQRMRRIHPISGRHVTRASDQNDRGRRLNRIRAVRSRKQITCQSATDRLLI